MGRIFTPKAFARHGRRGDQDGQAEHGIKRLGSSKIWI